MSSVPLVEAADGLPPEAAASYHHFRKQIAIVTAGGPTPMRGLGDLVGELYLAALRMSADHPDSRRQWSDFISALALLTRKLAYRDVRGDLMQVQALAELRQIVNENADLRDV